MKRRSEWGAAALVIAALGGGCQLIVGLEPVELIEGDGGLMCAMNGARDGQETDVDCGGGGCPGCGDGKGCQVGPDCVSEVCTGGTCAAPVCTDQKKNGDETDVDCGGDCGGCGAGKACEVDGDCKSAACEGGVCQATCTDAEKDGSETGIDCGGGSCPACKDGDGCAVSGDCESGVCVGGMCAQNFVWAKRFGDSGVTASTGTDVGVDSLGNVFLTGGLNGSADFGGGVLTSVGSLDLFVAKFGPTGNNLWTRQFGDVSGQSGLALAVDTGGSVVVSGGFSGTLDFGNGFSRTSAGLSDAFIVKLDPSGKYLWSVTTGSAGVDLGKGVSTDSAGNVFATGQFTGTVNGFGNGPMTSAGGSDAYLVRFNANGNALWTKHFGDASNQYGIEVAADKSGNVALVGYFLGEVDFGGGPLVSAGGIDMFVAKFDSMGGHLWSKSFGGANDQSASAVGVDADGNIIVVGSFAGVVDFGGGPRTSAGGEDLFMVKFDPQGNHLWSKSFGDASDQGAGRVAVDGTGGIAVFASGDGTIDFGGGPLTSAGGPMGGGDIFVAKFDSSGKHLWSRRFGDGQVQSSAGIAVGGSGDVVLTGDFGGLLDFRGGSGPLMNVGGDDIFLAKLLIP